MNMEEPESDELTFETSSSPKKKMKITRIPRKTTIIIFLLGIAGQLAWAIENSWFNVFVFEEITPDPAPVAWMVAVSAITATFTTLIMGSVSDKTRTKWGRRKPFIVGGYIMWGIITAIFPTVALIHQIGVGIVMVIIMDAVMTFFGSTANDAAFNAWTTDISDSSNRGTIQAYLAICALIGNAIGLVAAGILIERYGFFAFFYLMGAIVSIIGIIIAKLLEEPSNLEEDKNAVQTTVFADLRDTFRRKTISENKYLYLVLMNMALSAIGGQVYMPYVFVFLEYFLGIDKSAVALVGGIVILIAAISCIFIGFNVQKVNRRDALIVIAIMNLFVGLAIPYIVESLPLLVILLAFQTIFQMGGLIYINSWLQDLYPAKNRGKFQGIRLIFMVMIPMIIGPPIGAYLVTTYGIPTIINDNAGFIPTPIIFQVGATIAVLSVIPLLFIPRTEGWIKNRRN